MTKERIEDFREVVIPFVRKRLLETNYEGLGKSDAEEFAKDFDEILNLAKSALNTDVIITDYELPKSCYDCNLHNYHYCDVTGSCIEQNWDECTKADDCPLKEVPSETFYDQMVKYCDEHFLALVEKDVWEDAKKALNDKLVLEDIKAEIKEMRSRQNCSCSDCLDIIDKYIKSEDNK